MRAFRDGRVHRPEMFLDLEMVRLVREALRRDRDGACYPQLYARLAEEGLVEEKVFLRFGNPPPGGRSQLDPIFADGFERGVSVFPGSMTRDGHYLVGAPNLNLRWGLQERTAEFRPAFLVRGKVCGRGACGEPLIATGFAIEPVPAGCVVACDPPSRNLDLLNVARIGRWLEDVPELAHLFDGEDE